MKVQTLLHLNKKTSDIEEEIKKDQMAKSEAFEAVFFSFGEDIKVLCKTEEDVGQAEKQILKKLFELGLAAIMFYLAMKRRAPQKRMKGPDGRTYHYDKEKEYELRSIFGQGSYYSSQYQRGENRKPSREIAVIDHQVGLLPSGGLSPNLGIEIVELCSRMAYEQAKELLEKFRPYVPSTRSICGIIDMLGFHGESVLDDLPLSDVGEVAVVQTDARSMPRIHESEYEERCKPHKKKKRKETKKRHRRRRLSPCSTEKEKKQQKNRHKTKYKKQVTVGIIYTLTKQADRSWEGPKGKYIARFGNAETVFKRLRQTLDQISSQVKKVIYLSDGAPQYRRLQQKYFPEAIAVLDFYHAAGYLWQAGATVYPEGSEDLDDFVAYLKRLLKRGEVDVLLSILRSEKETIPHKGPGTKQRREKMQQAINYLGKRVDQMLPYKELRSEGLEIGSGAVESAIRQVVVIRFDGPGMKWGEKRSQLLLHMLCLRLSDGGWDAFTETIRQWCHQVHDRVRITPIGVNEKKQCSNSERPQMEINEEAKIVKNAA